NRSEVEIRRRSAVHSGTILLHEYKLKALRNGSRFARASRSGIADRMFEINEETGLLPLISLVDEYGSLGQQRLKPFEHHVDQRLQQRVTRRNEFGLRLTYNEVFLKRDPGIAVENR